jgi:hypothetical protein
MLLLALFVIISWIQKDKNTTKLIWSKIDIWERNELINMQTEPIMYWTWHESWTILVWDDKISAQTAIQNNLSKKIATTASYMNTNVDELLWGVFREPYSHDLYLQRHQKKVRYEMMNTILQKEWMNELLPSLIELAVDLHRYDDALGYIQLAQKNREILQRIPPLRLLQIITSAWNFDNKHKSEIKQLVDNLYSTERITQASKDFYYALLAFVNEDLDNYSYYMDQLVNTEYESRYYAFQDHKQQTWQYQDVSNNYVIMLIALRYFREWYHSVSLRIAEKVTKQESNYVLAHQILAYSSILRGDYPEALQSLLLLEERDKKNNEVYIYYQGVVYFIQNNYTAAITQFLRIRSQELKTDTMRYLFVSYLAIQDTVNANKAATIILESLPWERTVFDYFTMFDELFFNWSIHITPVLEEWLKQFVSQCYVYVPTEQHYICLYWEAWNLLVNNNLSEAYSKLWELVNRYPSSQMYMRYALVARELWYIDHAKRLIAHSLITSNNTHEKMYLKNLFTTLTQ